MTKSGFFADIGIADFLILVSLIGLLGAQLSGFAGDPGVGWHLATGKLVLQQGIPQFDPFLASAEPRIWVSDQWLSDVILYKLFELGSWSLIYTVLTIVFIFTFLVLSVRNSYHRNKNAIAAILSAIILLKCAQIHFILRPVIFSFFIFGIVFSLILRAEEQLKSGSAKLTHRLIIWLPPLFILWANLHPGFSLGLAMLAVWAISKIHNARTFKTLLGLTLVCCIATLVNPYGIKLHQSILELGSSQYFMNLHSEWKSPDFKEIAGVLFMLSMATIAAASFFVRRFLSTFEFLLLIVFGALSLHAIRVLPFFAIIAAPILATSLQLLGLEIRKALTVKVAFLSNCFSSFEIRESKTKLGLVSFVVISFFLLTFTTIYRELPFRRIPLGPPPSFPYMGIKEIMTRAEQTSKPLVIASTPDWGGFLSFFGEGRLKPLIDDRNTLVGESFYKKFMANMSPGQSWHDYLIENEVDYLILPVESKLGNCIKANSSLELIFADKVSMVFKL